MTETTDAKPTLEPPPRKTHVMRRWLRPIVMILLLALVFHRTLVAHVRLALDPTYVNDDARQLITPLLHYYDASLFRGDYIQDYYRAALPEGFRVLYRLTSPGWDPRAVSRVLPYPLLIAFVLLVGLSTHRLGGWLAAGFAMAFVLTAGVFLDRITGGLPRSFAFPVVGLAAAALVLGRAYWLAVATVLGAAFYPVVAVIAGLALAVLLLLLVPAKDRGDASTWRIRKRLIVLAVTALIVALLVLPNVLRLRRYGAPIRWDHASTKRWPELGRQGRYRPNDRAPFPNVARAAGDATALAFTPMTSRLDVPGGVEQRARWIAGASLAMVGLILLAWKKPEGRRLLALPVAALIGYFAARVAPPLLYLPQRYTLFVLPLIAVIALPSGLTVGISMLVTSARMAWLKCVLVALVCGAMLWSMRAGAPWRVGYTVRVEPDLPVIAFLRGLPPDALIAGWPRGGPRSGIINDVPYLTGRRALITFETHQIFHTKYAAEMRRRMRALVDAYFATDVTPLLRLRDEFHVTHLLVYPSHLRAGEGPPTYFEPFGDQIRDRWQAAVRDGTPVVLQLKDSSAAVYRDDSFLVLDLRRLDQNVHITPR